MADPTLDLIGDAEEVNLVTTRRRALLLAPDPTEILHPVVPVLSDFVAVNMAGLYGDGCVMYSRLNGPVEIKIAVLAYRCVINGIILNIDQEAGFLYPLLASLAICQIG